MSYLVKNPFHCWMSGGQWDKDLKVCKSKTFTKKTCTENGNYWDSDENDCYIQPYAYEVTAKGYCNSFGGTMDKNNANCYISSIDVDEERCTDLGAKWDASKKECILKLDPPCTDGYVFVSYGYTNKQSWGCCETYQAYANNPEIGLVCCPKTATTVAIGQSNMICQYPDGERA